MNTENYYHDISGFVTRKKKNRKKGKKLTINTSIANDNKLSEDLNNAESAVESICTDIDDEEEAEVENCAKAMNRVSVDGMMKAPPQYEANEMDRLEPIYYKQESLPLNQYSPTEIINTKALQKSEIIEQQIENNLEMPRSSSLEVPKIIETFENYDDVQKSGDSELQTVQYNKKALSKDSATYELEKFEKNALIIFNQENIEGHKRRLGTEKDVQAMISTFNNYGFEVVEHKDKTKDELFRELKSFCERDFTDYGCVAVAVLTHGSNNGMLRAKDQQYSETEIVNHFKTHDKPSLVSKPKLIIIQACRGTKIMSGVPVFQSGKIRKDLDEDLEPYFLPAEADLLLLHSSYAGSASHRDELHGSWFIQSLCNKIDQLAPTHDLESIITEVKREVAIDRHHEEYNRRTFEMDINKQMPVTTSTLIRKLYLKRFGERAPVEKVSQNITESSRFEVLDNASPLTPLLTQMAPCLCFLNHFTYIRNCLKYYAEDNPHDETALLYLELSSTFEEEVEFNRSKETMAKAICKHLIKNAKNCHFYKYLYFYKH